MSRTRRGQPTVDQMGAKRRALLEVLYAKGTARTSELRRDADIPQGSKRYHFDRLRVDPSDPDVDSWGYIQVVDEVPSEFGGSDERVWSLTSAGEEYVEETLSVDPTTREEGLTTRIEALERTVREQQAQIEAFEDSQTEAKEIASEARSTAEAARQTAEKAREAAGEFDSRLTSLREKHQALRDDHDRSGDVIIEKFNGLKETFQTQIDNLEADDDRQESRIEELEREVERIQERAADAEDEKGGFWSTLSGRNGSS